MRLRARPRRPGGGGKRTRCPPGPPSGPGREFQPFPATPADTLRLANELLRMQSEHFSNHAFVLAPERVRPHATPFTGVSQIPTAPLVFTARQFRASSLWFRSLVCGARCGARTPLSSGRSSRLARSFWIVGHQAGCGGLLARPRLRLSHLNVAPLPFAVEEPFSWWFSLLFQQDRFHVQPESWCVSRGGNFGTFPRRHLGPHPPRLIFFLQTTADILNSADFRRGYVCCS